MNRMLHFNLSPCDTFLKLLVVIIWFSLIIFTDLAKIFIFNNL